MLLIPCLPLIVAWNQFIVPAGTNVSDVLITHYPNLLFIQRSLLEGSGIPLWSLQILSGYPFAANPLSTLWYLPAWLALIFPLPLGINLVIALHILIGGFGMVNLLHKLQVKEPVVWLGAVLYGLLPAGFSHVVAGHFTWVCASAWLPWLLSFTYTQREPGAGKVILPAAALGLIMLADLRFAAYAVLIWIMQNIYLGLSEKKTRISAKLTMLGMVGLSITLAVGISAVVWLPLIEYTALSTRSLMTVKETFFLSLPILQMIGFVVTGQPSTLEWVAYLGAGIVIPVLFSFGLLKRQTILILWWIVAVLCFFWSFGEVNPINQWLVSLPGFNLLRVPSRGLFFLSFSLLMISMITLNDFLQGKTENIKYFRLGALGFTVLITMLQFGIYYSNPEKNSLLIWHLILTFIISGIILVFSYRGITGSAFIVVFSLAVICDLGISNWGFVEYRSLPDALSEGAEEAQYLASQGASFRVFSPSYSISQQTAANVKLELVDGIDPLQLTTYVDYVTKAAKLPQDGYSVTLPAFASGDPATDNAGIQPDAAAFGLLNMRYLVAAFPVEAKDWVLEKKTKNNYIYASNSARGWAWIEAGEPDISARFSSVKSITRTNNKTIVEAEGPGTLVLSEINYPGWQVTIDGQPAEIKNAYKLLRSVSIPDGTHEIHITFVPYLVYSGGGISLLSILLCVGLMNVLGRK
ncbi:MAG: YfhO family protein [Leptolinea sp.]